VTTARLRKGLGRSRETACGGRRSTARMSPPLLALTRQVKDGLRNKCRAMVLLTGTAVASVAAPTGLPGGEHAIEAVVADGNSSFMPVARIWSRCSLDSNRIVDVTIVRPLCSLKS